MQTRRLRLGDVVDDYCPRERRLSNHVIAAMVGDTIKQTRCSTCDFEHPYKEAKIPARRKKKDATSELFQQVLDNVTEGMKPPATAAPDETADAVAPESAPLEETLVPAAAASESAPAPEAAPAPAPRRRGASKRTAAAAAASAPLFPVESETPAPAAIASAAPASVAPPPSEPPPVAAPAAAAPSAGPRTRTASVARPAATTSAPSGLPAATLVKTPAPPPPAARAAAAAPASPAPAALVTAPRGVLRPAAPRETPGGAAQNPPAAMAAAPAAPDDASAAQPPPEEEAPLHRRALIRATLPRPVGEVPVRAIPTFTIREAAAARPNKFRHKGRPNGAARSRAPIGPMSMGNNQARPGGNTRGPQGRGGAAKKAGGHQPHRAGGHQPSRGQKGPQGGGKRFK